MNNEEKILSILENMRNDMDEIKHEMAEMQSGMVEMQSGMVEMKSDMVEMKSDMIEMKSDMKNVKERLINVEDKVVATNLIIENEIEPSIKILAEGHKGLVEKLWHLPEEVEDIKESVSILKFVQIETAKNSNK